MENKKIALITGATGGIGYEIAALFASKGYSLILVARNNTRLSEIQKDFTKKYHTEVFTCALDLAEQDAYLKVLKYIAENSLSVGYLVNNAGYGYQGEFFGSTSENYASMVKLNIITLTNLTYHLGMQMRQEGFGKILNVASVAAFQPDPYFAVYGATKAYVRSFSEALFHELKGSGVSITTLSPGLTYTGFLERAGMKSGGIMERIAMPVEAVALTGFNAMMRGKRHVVPGFAYKLMALFSQLLPVSKLKLSMISKTMKP